jgi:hypothetical protein
MAGASPGRGPRNMWSAGVTRSGSLQSKLRSATGLDLPLACRPCTRSPGRRRAQVLRCTARRHSAVSATGWSTGRRPNDAAVRATIWLACALRGELHPLLGLVTAGKCGPSRAGGLHRVAAMVALVRGPRSRRCCSTDGTRSAFPTTQSDGTPTHAGRSGSASACATACRPRRSPSCSQRPAAGSASASTLVSLRPRPWRSGGGTARSRPTTGTGRASTRSARGECWNRSRGNACWIRAWGPVLVGQRLADRTRGARRRPSPPELLISPKCRARARRGSFSAQPPASVMA